jgi:hypothetical protein
MLHLCQVVEPSLVGTQPFPRQPAHRSGVKPAVRDLLQQAGTKRSTASVMMPSTPAAQSASARAGSLTV